MYAVDTHKKDNIRMDQGAQVAPTEPYIRLTASRRSAQRSGPAKPVGSMKGVPGGPSSEPNGGAPADDGTSAEDIERWGSDTEPYLISSQDLPVVHSRTLHSLKMRIYTRS